MREEENTDGSTKRSILVVNEEKSTRNVLARMCCEAGFDTIEAENGHEGLEKADAFLPDLILMDLAMSDMDGFAAVKALRNSTSTSHIPVIIVSRFDSLREQILGFQQGADDYIIMPCDFRELVKKIERNIKIMGYSDFLDQQGRLRQTGMTDAPNEEVSPARWVDAISADAVIRLARVAEYREDFATEHDLRMGDFARQIAQVLGNDEAFAEELSFAVQLHDIGNVTIPDSILYKPGSLNPSEWGIVKAHAETGEAILANSPSGIMQLARSIAGCHHECWDGSGYPRGLSGEEIPLAARIALLADRYDILRSCRPYKLPLDHQSALKAILKGDRRSKPEHFDPRVLQAFADCHPLFRDLYVSRGNPDIFPRHLYLVG